MQCDAAKMREEALTKFDFDGCKKKGGYVDGGGMWGLPYCKIEYADGGKPCTDNSQCQGKCTIELGYSPERTEPTCQTDNSWDGCRSEVVDGVIQPSYCVD